MTILVESLDSTNLAQVTYDTKTGTLTVYFMNESKYEYYGVPVEIYEGLVEAISHGSYFHREIRNGGYHFKRLL